MTDFFFSAVEEKLFLGFGKHIQQAHRNEDFLQAEEPRKLKFSFLLKARSV